MRGLRISVTLATTLEMFLDVSCNVASKIRRLSNLEVSDFIVAKNVTTVEQLFAKADDRMQEGEFDLANFLFSRTQKSG